MKSACCHPGAIKTSSSEAAFSTTIHISQIPHQELQAPVSDVNATITAKNPLPLQDSPLTPNMSTTSKKTPLSYPGACSYILRHQLQIPTHLGFHKERPNTGNLKLFPIAIQNLNQRKCSDICNQSRISPSIDPSFQSANYKTVRRNPRNYTN